MAALPSQADLQAEAYQACRRGMALAVRQVDRRSLRHSEAVEEGVRRSKGRAVAIGCTVWEACEAFHRAWAYRAGPWVAGRILLLLLAGWDDGEDRRRFDIRRELRAGARNLHRGDSCCREFAVRWEVDGRRRWCSWLLVRWVRSLAL